jgi:hypothetical protein
MSIETVPGTNLTFHLIAFDDAGRERPEPGGQASAAAVAELANQPVTDVFLMSHGWLGDLPSARSRYQGWVAVMAGCAADFAQARQTRPGFRPLLIGVHWPSLPWGDERIGPAAASFAAPTAEGVEAYARRLGDTPAVRQALEAVFTSAAAASAAPATRLPPDLVAAYQALDRATGLGSGGVAAPPGADREPFDADRVFEAVRGDAPSFAISLPSRDDLLAPVRTLSFWKMKDRARQFGEGGAAALLAALQQAAGEDRGVRFHLMGHSFGSIVVSGMLTGPGGGGTRPVQSLALVQGAMSLWSYCDDIPAARGHPGYFRALVADGHVRGPIVTTQSEFDTAVGRWYPLAAGAARQVAFAVGGLPKYGGLGTFGVQGPGPALVPGDLLPVDGSYGFEAGKVYNLAAGRYIRQGGGFSGAHSDIDRPEVAHAIWQAAVPG